jgi:hypothetical protein
MYFNLNSRLLPGRNSLDYFLELLNYKRPIHKGVPFSEFLFDRILPEYPPFHQGAISGTTLYTCLGANMMDFYLEKGYRDFDKRISQVFSYPSAPGYLNPVFQTPVYWVNEYCPLLGESKPWEEGCEDYIGIFMVQSTGPMDLPQIFISPERAHLTIEHFRERKEVPDQFKRLKELIDSTDSLSLFRFLLGKIIIHEYAHSLMWFPSPNGLRWEFGFQFVEESLANYITMIHACTEDKLDLFYFVNVFIGAQAPAYRAAHLIWQAFDEHAYELAYFWKLVKAKDYVNEPVSFSLIRIGEGQFEYRMRDRQNQLLQTGRFTGEDLPQLLINEEIEYWKKPEDDELKTTIQDWVKVCHRFYHIASKYNFKLNKQSRDDIRKTFLRVLGIQRWELSIP